jgi:formate hydrogenlyase subunit 3/multisubunit Na+/H+ antiporter MnhD subunit
MFRGLLCLALSLLLRSKDLRRVALGILFVVALLTVPVYLTGEPAEQTVEDREGVSHELIERHQSLAKVALATTIVMGIVAALGLLGEWRRRPMPKGPQLALFLVGLAVAIVLAWTASLGGKIRRPEIRREARVAAFAELPSRPCGTGSPGSGPRGTGVPGS